MAKRELSLCVIGIAFLCASRTDCQFISSDSYTCYELLSPDTHQFKIYYEVTETRARAKFHFNPIREGSEASDESVIDAASGKQLEFEVVTGAQAKEDSPSENFSPSGKYIKVHLAHPVPQRGEYRLIIIKTYKDDKSYYTEGGAIVYKRSLGIPRNSVVLPPGYEVESCSVASQLFTEPDGRLKLAFVNAGSGGQLEVTIRAKRLPPPKPITQSPEVAAPGSPRIVTESTASNASTSPLPTTNSPPSMIERAYQDREILYELQAPESHAFRITHDYTARKPGERYYFNVVRAGSHVSDPESLDLDTGENLKLETITGRQAKERKLPLTEEVKDDAELVVTALARPLATGTTNRIRLKETYVDAKSYYQDGDELVWDRTFGRLRNTVVLPQGWYLTALATPAVVQRLADGRVSVYIVNPRNDDVRVYLRARKSAGG